MSDSLSLSLSLSLLSLLSPPLFAHIRCALAIDAGGGARGDRTGGVGEENIYIWCVRVRGGDTLKREVYSLSLSLSPLSPLPSPPRAEPLRSRSPRSTVRAWR